MNLSLPDHLKITLSPEQPFYHLECYLVMRSNCKDTEAINRWRLGRAKHEPRRSGAVVAIDYRKILHLVYTQPPFISSLHTVYIGVSCACVRAQQ